MKTKLIFLGILLLAIVPFVYAETISDSVEQKMIVGSVSMDASDLQGQTPLQVLLAQDPKFREAFRKILILGTLFLILFIVDLFLRGMTMWLASKREQKTWFWFLFIVNSMCILPIIYLLIYGKSRPKKRK